MKVKQLKFLQFFTVLVFGVIVISGLIVVFTEKGTMEEYKDFVQAIWPIFIAEVIPAFLGKPLTEAVRNIKGKECGEK